jgi:hypothetical protein
MNSYFCTEMIKTVLRLCIAAFSFLLMNAPAAFSSSEKAVHAVISEKSLENTDGFVMDFFSVFEEGILQASTGVVHSSPQTVRNTSSGSLSNPGFGFNTKRFSSYHFLKSLQSGISLLPELHILLCVHRI